MRAKVLGLGMAMVIAGCGQAGAGESASEWRRIDIETNKADGVTAILRASGPGDPADKASPTMTWQCSPGRLALVLSFPMDRLPVGEAVVIFRPDEQMPERDTLRTDKSGRIAMTQEAAYARFILSQLRGRRHLLIKTWDDGKRPITLTFDLSEAGPVHDAIAAKCPQ